MSEREVVGRESDEYEVRKSSEMTRGEKDVISVCTNGP